MNPLDIALHYASTGWPVFPCRPADEEVVDPATGEIETKSEKSPYTSNGLRGATKLDRIIRRWWKDTPDAMIGVPTGAPSGFWVLDIDIPGPAHPEDGRIWLAEMADRHGALPPTRTATTAGGGKHYLWRHHLGVRNRGALSKGVDTRGDGGFIIAPGSMTRDGRQYEWDNDLPIADAPDWLLDLVLPKASTMTACDAFSYAAGTNDHYVNKAVDDELRLLASTGKGGRGTQLNTSAFSLGTMVGAGALDRTDAEMGLYEAAISNGLVATDGERECRAKIRRGLDAGIRNPRNIPESNHDNTNLIDISRMLANAREKEQANRPAHQKPEREEGAATPGDDPEREESPRPPAPEPDLIPNGNISSDGDNRRSEDTLLWATPFKWIDPKTLPRREFAFGTHYIRKYVSVTVAPGGLGKTSNSIVEALAMACGKPLAGVAPPQKLKVWLFNAEDPRDELERRLMAACIHYNLKPDDFEGRLFLDSGREQELVVAREDKKSGVSIVEPVVEAMARMLLRHEIDVMIVDPFVSTHRVNENDNGAIDAVAKLWAQVANDTNCAIDIVHHLRKVADREATVEDARGAVSLIGAARSVRVLNRMTPEQAKQAALAEDDRHGYFSITYGKSNLTKLSHKADWRRLESVPLGNGRGLGKPQDFAPVAEEWKWPSAEDMADEVPVDDLEIIKARVRGSDYSTNYQAENWIGRLVADIMQVELPAGKTKSPEHKRIEKIVDAWVGQGHFVVELVKGLNIKYPERTQPIVRAA